jgi:hypothetical protein
MTILRQQWLVTLGCIGILATSTVSAEERQVVLQSGDLLVRYKTGQEGDQKNITECHCVSNYDQDGDQVIYVRIDDRYLDGTPKTSIVVADIASGRILVRIGPSFLLPSGRVFVGPVAAVGLDMANLRYYALLADGATKHTLIRIDGGSPKINEIGYAIGIQVIRSGKYKGKLIALLRKSKLSLGMWNPYYVIDSNGEEIGYIGQTEGEVGEFLEIYNQ